MVIFGGTLLLTPGSSPTFSAFFCCSRRRALPAPGLRCARSAPRRRCARGHSHGPDAPRRAAASADRTPHADPAARRRASCRQDDRGPTRAARDGTERTFADAVAIDFCDPEQDLFGAVTDQRVPGRRPTRVDRVLFVGGELVADRGRSGRTVIEDWERRARRRRRDRDARAARALDWVTGRRGGLELELEALATPLELADDRVGARTGSSSTSSSATCAGRLTSPGARIRFDCCGGASTGGASSQDAFDALRILYAVSRRRRRSASRRASGRQRRTRRGARRGALSRRPGRPAVRGRAGLDRVRRRGLAAKVGLELWRRTTSFRARSAARRSAAPGASAAATSSIVAFFRWSIDGEPAYGCYELRPP